jgi:signal recognition particle receptor subunit beta
MWEILSEGMLGFVVVVDSTRPETFREARSILETFRAYAPTPYVVAANKQDRPDAWDPEDMRIALRLDPKTRLLSCVAVEKESVKNVLLELLYSILAELELIEPAIAVTIDNNQPAQLPDSLPSSTLKSNGRSIPGSFQFS